MSGYTTENSILRIERVLRDATQALPVEEISRLSGGVSLQATRTRLQAMVQQGRAKNVGRKGAALYLWSGPREDDDKMPHYWRDAKPYTGEQANPTRPGALDFLAHPHLIGGQRVPRVRPVLISFRGES